MRIEALDFHHHAKGTLIGFTNLALGQSGLRIRHSPLYQENGKWWVTFPGRSYTPVRTARPIGSHLLKFNDEDRRKRLQEGALATLRVRLPSIFPASLGPARDRGS
jgi:hypothetical protein